MISGCRDTVARSPSYGAYVGLPRDLDGVCAFLFPVPGFGAFQLWALGGVGRGSPIPMKHKVCLKEQKGKVALTFTDVPISCLHVFFFSSVVKQKIILTIQNPKVSSESHRF